jgi:hypothetical protein
VSLNKLINYLLKYGNLFVVEAASFGEIMRNEIDIAFMAGIPFKILPDNCLKPLTCLNMDELSRGVPDEVKDILHNYTN